METSFGNTKRGFLFTHKIYPEKQKNECQISILKKERTRIFRLFLAELKTGTHEVCALCSRSKRTDTDPAAKREDKVPGGPRGESHLSFLRCDV